MIYFTFLMVSNCLGLTLPMVQRKPGDIKFGTWIVRSLYRPGSLKTVATELARYKLDLVGIVDVRWDKGRIVRTGDYTFFYGKGNENLQWGTDLLYSTKYYQQLIE